MKENENYLILKIESKSGFMKERIYKHSKKNIVTIFNLVRKKNYSVFYSPEDTVHKAKRGDFNSIEDCLFNGGKYETSRGYKAYWYIASVTT